MFTNYILFIEVFIFVFCSLNVIKNLYNIVKVLASQEGKLDTTLVSNICFGLSVAYIIATIVTGF